MHIGILISHVIIFVTPAPQQKYSNIENFLIYSSQNFQQAREPHHIIQSHLLHFETFGGAHDCIR